MDVQDASSISVSGSRMFSRLFGSRGEVPDSEIVYAIGDIHGRDDLLDRLHDSIEQDLSKVPEGYQATVVYLGDYVDRGPDSKAVIDRLIDRPIKAARRIHLKGNHEDALLRFLAGDKGGESWLTIGGGATAKSYGVSLRNPDSGVLPPDVVRAQLHAAIPQRHLDFLQSLTMTYEAGDYLFVHAGIRPGRDLEEQDPRDLLWIRRDFLKSRRRHGKIVVHGHSSHSDVVVKANRICVDTAAYASDRLTCVVLEGERRRFITAEF